MFNQIGVVSFRMRGETMLFFMGSELWKHMPLHFSCRFVLAGTNIDDLRTIYLEERRID